MKIYVITKGYYSDYHICAVATDPDKAKRLAQLYTDKWDDARVEEYDTDNVMCLLEGRLPFSVHFSGGVVWHVSDDKEYLYNFEPGVIERTEYPHLPSNVCEIVRVYAPDEETAKKIAIDKRAQYLAEKAGI